MPRLGTHRSSLSEPARSHWPQCAGLALLDVEATYLVVLAYRFTSLTSVTLLDCTTIPGAPCSQSS